MHSFLMDMKALNLQKRTVALVENGSWAPLIRRSHAGGTGEAQAYGYLGRQPDHGLFLQEQNLGEMDALADAIAASVNQ